MCYCKGFISVAYNNSPISHQKILDLVPTKSCVMLSNNCLSPFDGSEYVSTFLYSSEYEPDSKMLKRLATTVDHGQFWVQVNCDEQNSNTNCFVWYGKDGSVLYEMQGTIVEGENAHSDEYRKVRDDFSLNCPLLNTGISQYCTDDEMILLRKYDHSITIKQLNGTIIQDKRTSPEKGERLYYFCF